MPFNSFKNSRQVDLPFLLAGITAIFAAIAIIIVNYLTGISIVYLLFGTVIIVFLVVFIVLRTSLRSFVYKKINPIYNTIHKVSMSQSEFYERFHGENSIEELGADAIDWTQHQTQEIDQLKQMAKYRQEFLGNVSHELKTPIFNIQGYVLTLLDGGIDDPSINKIYLERTEKSINRMISIVEDLESIARLESGELTMNLVTFNIVQLVEDVFENQDIRAQKRNIRLVIKNALDEMPVKADKERIFEAINNLVVNTINYGKNNGKTIVSLAGQGDKILVEVSDNGLGIAETDIPRIFERFYRVDRSRSRNMGGTGLGLAIVKHVVEAHDQTLSVRSKLGEGTVFSLTLAKA
jgi:two-component system phosphate regulon sensor histidine kinase PhoR